MSAPIQNLWLLGQPNAFHLLGHPLRTTRPTFQDFTPLLSEIENSLMGVSRYLSYHGRLILVNSIFSDMLTFYVCTLKLPPTVIEEIDKYRKHALWSGAKIHRAGSCLATWDTTCRPKEEGGLGIINLQIENTTLLLKFLDKVNNHANMLWVTLTWNTLYTANNIPLHAKNP